MRAPVKLRDFALKIKMKASKEFWEYPEHKLRNDGIYNGAGPDWLPKWGRVILTFFLRIFAAAILIHDFRFHFSDKTEKTFKQVNREFYDNMMLIVKYYFGGWFLGAFGIAYNYWATKAYLAYAACKNHGWSAWIA